MARFLVAVWPLAGHCFPNLAIANALKKRGHEVRFYTGARLRKTLEEEGFELFPFQAVNEQHVIDVVLGDGKDRGPWARLMEKRERYRRLILDGLPGQVEDLEKILDSWQPDVLICDPLVWAPFLVLQEKRNLRIAIFAYVPFSPLPHPDAPPMGLGLGPPDNFGARVQVGVARPLIHMATAGIRKAANKFRESHGLPPLKMTVSEWAGTMPLYLVAGTPGFDYGRRVSAPNVKYVGPVLWRRAVQAAPAPWIAELPEGLPLVHVSEGTVHNSAPIVLQAAAKGLANLPMHVSIATGTQRDPEALGLAPLAPNVRVDQWVTYPHLLPRTQVVVTTAGAGTVLETLCHGIPLVVIPTDWDKPEMARRVERSGAGIHLPPSRCNAQTLREAVERVLREPSFRENAQRLAREFGATDGPETAALELERLAAGDSAPAARAVNH